MIRVEHFVYERNPKEARIRGQKRTLKEGWLISSKLTNEPCNIKLTIAEIPSKYIWTVDWCTMLNLPLRIINSH